MERAVLLAVESGRASSSSRFKGGTSSPTTEVSLSSAVIVSSDITLSPFIQEQSSTLDNDVIRTFKKEGTSALTGFHAGPLT